MACTPSPPPSTSPPPSHAHTHDATNPTHHPPHTALPAPRPHLSPVQVFTEVFSREHQLIRADPRHATYLACGLIARGSLAISDLNRNVAKIRPHLNMVHWNSEVTTTRGGGAVVLRYGEGQGEAEQGGGHARGVARVRHVSAWVVGLVARVHAE